MTRAQKAHFVFELSRAASVSGLSALVFLFLYVAPTCLEALLINHLNPSLAVAAVGDVSSYLVLYFLGFRRTAAAVYLLSKFIEITLLKSQMITMSGLIWVSDLLPTITCCLLLSWMIFFSSKMPFSEQK
jgi:hypothetical protein